MTERRMNRRGAVSLRTVARRVAAVIVVASAAPSAGWSDPAPAPGGDLARLSLEELSGLEVTSVSKTPERLQAAAASIYVITHDDLLQAGATSLMEALRLAPNLLVTQVTATSYTISSRGFGGNAQSQNFSNKLLMLIDGRSVYTPLYSGIYSDAQDVPVDDIDRIEVISGAGATLWGANAMNGVINVITRPSYLTEGTFLGATAGDQQQGLTGRYGGRIAGDLSYRVYGMGFHRAAADDADGRSAGDGWTKAQGGFRADWSTDHDSVTVQGDAYRAAEESPRSADGAIAGADVLARYDRRTAGSAFQLQVYADQSQRFGPPGSGGGGFVLQTYDVQLQQTVEVGDHHRIVWGGGQRLNRYAITNQRELLFLPDRRSLAQSNLFAQDTIALGPAVNLTAGLKLEKDAYWRWTPLPDGRLSWQASPRTAVWLDVAKAIRSATPFDVDVVEKVANQVFLTGNDRFRPELVTAYEAGGRVDFSPALTASMAAFYNHYDDLRTIETGPSGFLPLVWGNRMAGYTYGVEAWAHWQVTDRWRLSPGLVVMRERLKYKAGASRILGIAEAADDPGSHADLDSSLQLPHHVALDLTLRYVGALPEPAFAHYTELNGRLNWRATDTLDLALNGLNLLHSRHFEAPAAQGGEALVRSVMADVRWKF